jgi:hypothetical protein
MSPHSKDIQIGRRVDETSFCPRVFATYKGETLFDLSIEILQDIKYGDWSGFISGRPDPIQTNEYVENELLQICINDKPKFKEQIIEAFRMIKEYKNENV